MTPEYEALVRETWALLADRQAGLADAFYGRLFEMAPETRDLFQATDMREQRGKFTAMMTEIVRRIDEPEELVPEVAALGARHARYRVTPHDYGLVGDALVWALEQELGAAMTREARFAWSEAYLMLAGLMQRGAEVRTGSRTR